MSYFDDHEIIEVIVKCRHATDEVVEFTGDDIVRCKECVSYCGDGVPCLWGLKTGEMGFCHHGYRGGDCITEQTEPQDECAKEYEELGLRKLKELRKEREGE